MLTTMLVLALAWVVGSFPLAVLVGRMIRGPHPEAGRPAGIEHGFSVLQAELSAANRR